MITFLQVNKRAEGTNRKKLNVTGPRHQTNLADVTEEHLVQVGEVFFGVRDRLPRSEAAAGGFGGSRPTSLGGPAGHSGFGDAT